MDEAQALALGRRAKRCARWKWAPGMLVFAPALRGAGVPETGPLYARLASADGHEGWRRLGLVDLDSEEVPDLRDPATLGCLLALVRDAWPTAPATTARHGVWSEHRGHHHAWTCSYCTGGNWQQAHGETEAEAMVAALEAAGTQKRGEEDGV